MTKPTKHDRIGSKVKRKSLRWAATFHGEYVEYKGQLGIAEAFTIKGYGIVRVIFTTTRQTSQKAQYLGAGCSTHIHWHSKDKAELHLATVTDAVVSRLRGDPPLPEPALKTAPALIPMLKHLGKWDIVKPCQLGFGDKPS